MKHHFNSFWFGENLSPYEILCIKSFIDHGHSFSLYSYNELNVPAGVETRDANLILPREDVFFYATGPGAGSVAAFANRFRYALLYKLGGWWVDTDIICLSDTIPNTDCFFALEEAGLVNNAMIRFPAQHPVMEACLSEATNSTADNMAWGTTGPKLFTSILKELSMFDTAQTAISCYPIEWSRYIQLFDPHARTLVENSTRDSIAVHLWNELIRRLGVNKQKAPPRNSFMDHLCQKHQIEFPEGRMSMLEIRYLQLTRGLGPQI